MPNPQTTPISAKDAHTEEWGLAADAEISRLRELNSSLAYYLNIYVHAHLNDQRVPTDIECWAQKTLKDEKLAKNPLRETIRNVYELANIEFLDKDDRTTLAQVIELIEKRHPDSLGIKP